jgi:hypothetical protein
MVENLSFGPFASSRKNYARQTARRLFASARLLSPCHRVLDFKCTLPHKLYLSQSAQKRVFYA